MYYFAYGSNISEYRMINERKINYHSRKFAILKNYKLVFNKQSKDNPNISYANVEESLNDNVEGVLYLLDDKDIKILDKYEGYPNHYQKISCYVLCEGKYIECILYVANTNMINNNAVPTQKYLNYILEGRDLLSKEYFKLLTEQKTYENRYYCN